MIYLPCHILEKTLHFFQRNGENEVESFALWTGIDRSKYLQVQEVWFPQQQSTLFSYYIPNDEVHQINVKLNKTKQFAIAQLHTHPSEAFHSSIDDEFAILSLAGSLSVVIPHFGDITPSSFFDESAVYRLSENQQWELVKQNEVKQLFKLI